MTDLAPTNGTSARPTTAVDWWNPNTLDQAHKLAGWLANSQFCPRDFRGQPGDVLAALMLGATVGMSPTQALQGVAVINGRPALYGDSLVAVCRAHPQWEWMEEEFDASTMTATCKVKRKGEPVAERTFSEKDARTAGLWGKSGPWSQYPKRMLQMRARGFALRDTYPDALRGLVTVEEAEDMPPEPSPSVTVRPDPEPPAEGASASDRLKHDILRKRGTGGEVSNRQESSPIDSSGPDPAEPEPTQEPEDDKGADLRSKQGVGAAINAIAAEQGWDGAYVQELSAEAGLPPWKCMSELGMPDLRKLLAACEAQVSATTVDVGDWPEGGGDE